MRFLFLRIVLPVLLFLILRYVFKMIAQSMREQGSVAESRSTRSGGRLEKDPVCGTFVAPDAAVVSVVGGKTIHFCSTACRDRYRA